MLDGAGQHVTNGEVRIGANSTLRSLGDDQMGAGVGVDAFQHAPHDGEVEAFLPCELLEQHFSAEGAVGIQGRDTAVGMRALVGGQQGAGLGADCEQGRRLVGFQAPREIG